MKIAAQALTVYGSATGRPIGIVKRGEAVHVISEDDAGVCIAYITGYIRPEDAAALVSPEQWHSEADEKSKFLEFVAAQVGALYVWGAQGQTMTPALIRSLENSAANRERALAAYDEHVRTGRPLVAYDCSGLVVAYLLGAGLISSDRSANGLYRDVCRAIDKTQLTAGDLVFKKYLTKDQVYHVGVYMGDGAVVHAKGRGDGVVREALSKTGWNRFGRLKCWGDTQAEAVYTRLIKRVDKPYLCGDDVRAVQQKLEEKGYDTGGVDGVYGPNTQKAVKAYQQAQGLETDGIVGPKTWAALMG